MADRIWNEFLTERDKQMWSMSGYGADAGFGHRPSLLIIDVNYNFAGDRPEPLLDSIRRWRNSCGQEAWDAVPVIRRLIDICHQKGLPVIFSTGTKRPDNWDAGSWAWKNQRNREDVSLPRGNIDGQSIIAELAPTPAI